MNPFGFNWFDCLRKSRMNNTSLKVLLLEDNPSDARMLEYIFREASELTIEMTWAKRLQEALSLLSEQTFDVILTDLNLPDSTGLKTFQTILEKTPDIPLVVLTGNMDDKLGVEAVQLGAQDYLTKGEVDNRKVIHSIRYAIERHQTMQEIRRLNEILQRQNSSLQLLHMFSLELLHQKDIEKLLQAIADNAAILLHAGGCSILLMENGLYLRDMAMFPNHMSLPKRLWPRGKEPWLWEAFDTCKPVMVQDYPAQAEADPFLISAGTRAALYLPILIGNTCYGVIALGRPMSTGAYTEEDLRIGTLYAQLTALVIQNAQLYQEAQSELAHRMKAEEALIYERDLLHTLMDNVPDFIYFKDETLRFVRINRSYARHLGLKKPGDAVGKSEIELQRGESGKTILAEERDLLYGKIPSLDRVESSYTKTGELRWLSATKVPLHNQKAKITGLVGITRDVTERLWVEKRLQTQYGISQILENATDLSSAANQLLKVVCEALDWDMGELWLVSASVQELQLVELWHTETLDIGDWETFTRRRGFKLGDGFAGRVWAAQESVWMADVMNHPDFPPLFFAGKIGLHGAFGFGIRLGGEVLGVMTFFSKVIRQPDEEIIRMFKAISSQIAQFVERRRAEEALRQSEARLNYLLRRFVPRPVAEQLMDRQQGVQLGGEEREASVLFADIRNYMRIARAITPPELMNLLNRYFGIIGRVILKYGGTINQYAGDMIMATFNAPHEQPDHAARAVRCALEAQAALLQEKPPRGVEVPVQFGIGVNTGPVVVGYLGFEDRFDFATLGETTNLAFRFSSLAQGGQVIIGPTTFTLVETSLNYNLLDKTTLKGSDSPIQLYEALGWGMSSRVLREREKV